MNPELDYKTLMQSALQELRQLRSKVKQLEAAQAPENQTQNSVEPIAIIGMGCRFPGGVESPDEFWQMLIQGLDAITNVPIDRWNSDAYQSENEGSIEPGKMTTQLGGFVGHLQDFDAAFFGISPREAISLDPQQRLLLEVTWEALTQAGIIPKTLSETNTGVFLGLSSNDYSRHLLQRPESDIDPYFATGNSHSTAAGRIAFTLGLQGPAIAVDTACSSSLVAVHLACQSLRSGECELALVGGVNRIIAPEFSINFSQAKMLAADGRCKTFDQSADGFVRSEGAGIVVLKRLSAVKKTDRVFAVIRGSAVNQDGRSSGLTVPNGPAQQRVIAQALKQANIDPAQVNYVEAHGTGTALGDPIELGALQGVFQADRTRENPLLIGSVKTNIGHLEAAAGIAGLIKSVLMLQHRQVPPHLHLQKPTTKFDWSSSVLAIPEMTRSAHSTTLSEQSIVGVSSFGFSGTNAHIVLASPLSAVTNISALPLPPFQRQRYWAEIRSPERVGVFSGHPLLGNHIKQERKPTDFIVDALFIQTLNLRNQNFLVDHQVFGKIIFPGAGYLEIAIAAAIQKTQSSMIQLDRIRLQYPIELQYGTTEIQVATGIQEDHCCWDIRSEVNAQSVVHALGTFKSHPVSPEKLDRLLIEKTGDYNLSIEGKDYYKKLNQYGIEYGDRFRGIQKIWYREHQAIVQIELPIGLSLSHYYLHPVLLDSCLQAIGGTLLHALPSSAFLPIALEQLQFYRSAPAHIWAEITLKQHTDLALIVDISIWDTAGVPIAQLTDLQLKAVTQTSEPTEVWRDWLYQVNWQDQPCLASASWVKPLVSTIALEFTRLLAQPSLERYATHLEMLEMASLGYIIQAFKSLGQNGEILFPITTAQWAEQWKIIPAQRSLFVRLLRILAEEQYLVEVSDRWQLLKLIVSTSQILLDSQTLQSTDAILLDRCGTNLAAVLRGDTNPLQLLFPNGDWTTLTKLYQESPGTQITNELVQRSIAYWIECHAADLLMRPLKVLEIGAGTGGTTAHLLPFLTEQLGDRYEYTFTDISPIFLSKARDRFSSYVQVQYKLLNVERSPETQKFELGSFDIIVAANVLHATQDLGVTLAHVEQLLAIGGGLFIVEGVKPARWLDLIFGLTDGWWRFEDRDLRPYYPLIHQDQWLKLLCDRQFGSTAELLPEHTIPQALAQQAVIIAEKAMYSCQNWLILDDRSRNGEALKTALETQGQVVYLDVAENLESITLQHQINQVVYIPRIDQNSSLEDAYNACDRMLDIVQFLTSDRFSKTPKFSLITQEMQSNFSLEALYQSPSSGLGRVAALEYPKLQYRQIDVAESDDLNVLELSLELLSNTSEQRVSLQNTRQVARLEHYKARSVDRPQQLTMTEKGTLSNLVWQSMERRSPGVGEVEIAVIATGLNLIDVLDALSLLPFERDWFGVECAGTVVAIGEGVTHVAIGDTVVALAPGSFQQFVTVTGDWVVRVDQAFDPIAAATLPANFLTAYYSLHELKSLQPGTKILIHSAASGTGLAALQIAQWQGAEVYATASPSKWDSLRSMGVKHIFNSRTLDFADRIEARSLDVVFNALSGEFIPRSLELLRDGGRFVEIGKRGVWTPEEMGAARAEVQYDLVDLMQVAQDKPQSIQVMLNAVVKLIQTQQIQSVPKTVFKSGDITSAFRSMQQANHVGKIVVTYDDRPITISNETNFFDRHHMTQSSYLITGGMGGLGLQVAKWLAEGGASQIVLMGRSTPDESVMRSIQTIEALGCEVRVEIIDVCDFELIESVVRSLAIPLRGVIHAAGQLDDGVIQHLTPERLHSVLDPKVRGAWNLHQATIDLPLDFFVCFSSAASLLGSPGQANHVAANAFLDQLAHYRRSLGRSGLSLNWGAWSEVGAAAKRQVSRQMQQMGIGEISPKQGIAILQQLLEDAETPAQVGILPIDWQKFPLTLCQTPLFSQVTRSASRTKTDRRSVQIQAKPIPKSDLKPSSFLDRFSTANRLNEITRYLQGEFAQVLGLQQQFPDPNLGFFEMGMDSLMMVELQNRLESAIGQNIPTTTLFEYPTIAGLAGYLDRLLQPIEVFPILEKSNLNGSPPEEILREAVSDEVSIDLIQRELEALEALLKS